MRNMNDALIVKAWIAKKTGDTDKALTLARTALATCSPLGKKRLNAMLDDLETESVHGVPAKSVNIRNIQFADILDIPLKHGKTLESKSPGKDRGLDAERSQDLGTEYPGTAEFKPLPVEEDLQFKGGFGIREIAGTDVYLVEPHTLVELPDEGYEHV